MNALSQSVLGRKVFPKYQRSAAYTGELFGVAYLNAQSGAPFSTKEEDLDREIDEGFIDVEEPVTG